MKDASTLPPGVTFDPRGTGYVSIPGALSKFDPNVKYFCVLEAADYFPDGSAERANVLANCITAQNSARWPIPVVPGFTVRVVPNYGVAGFHFSGVWPGEKQIHDADTMTINPDVAGTFAAFIAQEALRADYVPPQNVNPGTWT